MGPVGLSHAPHRPSKMRPQRGCCRGLRRGSQHPRIREACGTPGASPTPGDLGTPLLAALGSSAGAGSLRGHRIVPSLRGDTSAIAQPPGSPLPGGLCAPPPPPRVRRGGPRGHPAGTPGRRWGGTLGGGGEKAVPGGSRGGACPQDRGQSLRGGACCDSRVFMTLRGTACRGRTVGPGAGTARSLAGPPRRDTMTLGARHPAPRSSASPRPSAERSPGLRRRHAPSPAHPARPRSPTPRSGRRSVRPRPRGLRPLRPPAPLPAQCSAQSRLVSLGDGGTPDGAAWGGVAAGAKGRLRGERTSHRPPARPAPCGPRTGLRAHTGKP